MYLDVGHGHRIHYEAFGNPKGIKVLFIHGGPGLGFSDQDKAFFDPEKFHVLFIDQRGCGKSIPKGELNHNTTQDLIADMALVLDHLNIKSVILFGGSWGATLAILFAAAYPQSVTKLILRGFFSATRATTDIYLRGKIKDTHPEGWKRVISFVPEGKKDEIAAFYFDALDHQVEGYQLLGYEWARYGLSLSRKAISEEEMDQLLSKGIDFDRIRIELNYATNDFFIPPEYVYDQAAKIANIPLVVVHGRYDYICPLSDAERLAANFMDAKLIIADAGHSTSEYAINEALFNELNQL